MRWGAWTRTQWTRTQWTTDAGDSSLRREQASQESCKQNKMQPKQNENGLSHRFYQGKKQGYGRSKVFLLADRILQSLWERLACKKTSVHLGPPTAHFARTENIHELIVDSPILLEEHVLANSCKKDMSPARPKSPGSSIHNERACTIRTYFNLQKKTLLLTHCFHKRPKKGDHEIETLVVQVPPRAISFKRCDLLPPCCF